MAQLTSRFEVAAAEFPFLSDQVGRTVVVDEEKAKLAIANTTGLPEKITKPQLMYAENILPAGTGYRSVGFMQASSPVSGSYPIYNVWEATDTSQRNCYIAATTDKKLWLFDEDYPRWLPLTTPAAWNGNDLSFARVSGRAFVFVPGAGLYELSGTTRDLVVQTVAGITEADALGICGSFGYLVFYDALKIYYSSATDPLDHVPSITTGAGSGAIQEAAGAIRFLKQTSLGINIYCEKNVVSAQYSSNIRYPWVFKAVDNSLGVGTPDRVTREDESGNQYCLTSGGMMAVNVKAAKHALPAVTDFLAAKRIETYNRVTHTSTFAAVPAGVITRLTLIASRWLVLSYGSSSYTQAIVYDSALKRWGKIVADHIAFVELFIDYNSLYLGRCSDMPYPSSLYAVGCDTVTFGGPSVDTDSSMLAFFDAYGHLNIAKFDFLFDTDALAIFGRFQLTRRKKCQVQELEVECVGASDLSATVLSSYAGKTLSVATPMYKMEASDDRVLFLSADAPEAENHCIEMVGSFYVTSQQITMTQGGRS